MVVAFRSPNSVSNIFNRPIDAMLGMFIMSLGEFADIYDSFSRTRYIALPKVKLASLSLGTHTFDTP